MNCLDLLITAFEDVFYAVMIFILMSGSLMYSFIFVCMF